MDDVEKRNKEFANKLKVFIPDTEIEEEEEVPQTPINVAFITGKLISKRIAVGTKSEGEEYWIIPNDDYKNRWDEVLVRKKTMMWQDDPQLHPMVGKMVKIRGDIIETRSTITVDCFEIEEIE